MATNVLWVLIKFIKIIKINKHPVTLQENEDSLMRTIFVHSVNEGIISQSRLDHHVRAAHQSMCVIFIITRVYDRNTRFNLLNLVFL